VDVHRAEGRRGVDAVVDAVEAPQEVELVLDAVTPVKPKVGDERHRQDLADGRGDRRRPPGGHDRRRGGAHDRGKAEPVDDGGGPQHPEEARPQLLAPGDARLRRREALSAALGGAALGG